MKSPDEAERKIDEARTKRENDSPLLSGGEAGEIGCEAVEQLGVIARINSLASKWDTLPESDYRVNIDIDNLPVRAGGEADFPPKLSIVLPVYNVDKWLADCLRSLQAQTFTAWEAILVDDGSTDLSGMICDHFAKQDERFRVIHQKNRGVSAARNKGLTLARAPWLSFMDPDDLIPETYYLSMLQFAEQNGAEWVTSDVLFFGNIKNIDVLNKSNIILGNSTVVFRTKEEIKSHFYELIPGGGWGFICTRATWGNIEFPEGVNIAEDILAYMQVLPKAKTAAFLNSVKYYYRKRDGSLLTKPMEIERYQNMLNQSDKIVNAFYADRDEFAVAVEKIAAYLEITNFMRAQKTMRKGGKVSILRAYNKISKETRGKTFVEWAKSMGEIIAKEY